MIQNVIATVWVYVLPVPLFVVMALLWWHRFPDVSFAAFILGVPIIYGYVVPGIATNLLKKWRFKGRFLIGRYYAHHGFLYGSKLTFLLYWPFILFPASVALGGARAVGVVLINGLMCAAVFWWGDIQLVRSGRVEIDCRAARDGRSPEEVVTRYAPLCFFLIGTTYAAGAVWAYQTFIVAGDTALSAQLRVWILGCLPLFTVPSLAYRRLDRDPSGR